MPYRPVKNWTVALLLSIFLGSLGIDRFYLGHIGLGVAKLLLSWMTFGVWWLIDIILIGTRSVNSEGFYWDDSQEAFDEKLASSNRNGFYTS